MVELILKMFKGEEVSVVNVAAMLEALEFGRTILAAGVPGDGSRPEGDFVAEGLDVWGEGDCAHHKFSAFFVGVADTL